MRLLAFLTTTQERFFLEGSEIRGSNFRFTEQGGQLGMNDLWKNLNCFSLWRRMIINNIDALELN